MTTTLSGGRGWLLDGAAQSIARIDKFKGSLLQITEAGRTYARQAYLYDGWVRRLPGFNRALPPGTSIHEKGEAIDSDDQTWMNTYGHGFGWRKTAWDERWHYEYFEVEDESLFQELLNRQGYDLVVDGQWGPASTAALQDFQNKKGIVSDGRPGPVSLTALKSAAPAGSENEFPARALYGAQWVIDGQNKLLRLSYDLGPDGADGYDGLYTQQAVKDVQAKAGIGVDGVMGPVTMNAIDARLSVGAIGKNITGRSTTELQQRLISLGYDLAPYGADGDYGAKTTAAVIEFQKAKGLDADGIYGPATDAALFGTTVPVPPADNVLDPTAPWKSQVVDSPLATWVGSPNYNFREPRQKDHITLHWMTSSLASTDAHFQNPGTPKNGLGTGTSSTYGIGQTDIHQYVKESDYVHSDGDSISNSTTISIEHEGGWLLEDGKTRQTPTREVCDLSAKLCADIAKRHGWAKLELGVNVFPHKHFVATQCPGTLDIQYIVDEANKILNPPVVVPPDPIPEPEAPIKAELQLQIGEVQAELDKLEDMVDELP